MSLEDLFVSEHYDELYIVMELLDSDLHRIIQSPQALGDAHHRYFMFQLLKGVKVRRRRHERSASCMLFAALHLDGKNVRYIFRRTDGVVAVRIVL